MSDLHSKWSARLSAFEEVTQKLRRAGIGAAQKSLVNGKDMTQLNTNRELLVIGRKSLSTNTKGFAKLTQEEKMAEFPTLLKQYQGYIDDLSKFIKHAENSFIEAHGFIESLPDPTPIMEKFSREKSTILEFVKSFEGSSDLRTTLAEREAELLELKNQEVTINKLREQLAEAEVAVVRSREISAEESAQELTDVLQEWQRREQSVQQQLMAMSQECRKYQQEAAELNNQLVEARTRQEEMATTAEADAETLLADLSDLQSMNSLLNKEIANLKAAADHHTMAKQFDTDPTDELSLATELRSVKSELQASLKRIHDLEQEKDSLSSTVDDMAAELQAAKKNAADTTELRSQLECEKREAEIAIKRADTTDSELVNAKAELNAMRAQLQQQESMVNRLQRSLQSTEKELREAHNHNNSHSFSDATGGEEVKRDTTDPGESVAAGDAPPAAKVATQDVDDMIATVASQRDRYRDRLFTLEEVTSKEIDKLKMEIVILKRDNARLLQSPTTNGGGGGGGNGAVDSSSEAMIESEHRAIKIHSLIEQGKGFAVPEFLDKAAVLLSRFVLANQTSRRIFLGYLVGVHVLVCLVLLERFLTDT